MTVSSLPYYHWNSRSDWMRPPFTTCSPSLVSDWNYLHGRWGGLNLGCHNDRQVSGGGSMSSHAWGSALDYLPNGQAGRTVYDILAQEVWPFLIAWSAELGINALHDYKRQAIWKPGVNRWEFVNIGTPAASHTHIEVAPGGWGDGRPVEQKISYIPPPPPPNPGPTPTAEDEMALWARFLGENADVAFDATGWRYITEAQRNELLFAKLLRFGDAHGYPQNLPQDWKVRYPQLG